MKKGHLIKSVDPGSKYVAMEYLGLRRMSVQCVSLQKTRNVKRKTIEI